MATLPPPGLEDPSLVAPPAAAPPPPTAGPGGLGAPMPEMMPPPEPGPPGAPPGMGPEMGPGPPGALDMGGIDFASVDPNALIQMIQALRAQDEQKLQMLLAMQNQQAMAAFNQEQDQALAMAMEAVRASAEQDAMTADGAQSVMPGFQGYPPEEASAPGPAYRPAATEGY